jgi:hypothetical protein
MQTQDEKKSVIDALRLGAAACLVASALEPISANWDKWKKAAEIIDREIERLER